MKERPTINAIRKKKERDFTPVSSSSLSSSSLKSRAFVPPFLCHFAAFFIHKREQTSPKYFKKRE